MLITHANTVAGISADLARDIIQDPSSRLPSQDALTEWVQVLTSVRVIFRRCIYTTVRRLNAFNKFVFRGQSVKI